MRSLADRVRATIRRFGLIPAGATVAAAVSGGSDSTALAVILAELAPALPFRLAGLVHLNHGLRGCASDEDEQFCRGLADRLGVGIEIERADVWRLAADRRISIEHAGHAARRAFFERAATRVGAAIVAVGHTRDDQAETLLLRLIRGAGPRGLAGIRPRSGLVVRPLLEVSREELRSYLQEREIDFREDASNRDVSIPRNRVRHELLPLLARRFSPAVADALARAATIAREDAELLDRLAGDAAERIITRTPDGVRLDLIGLVEQPPALARRLLQRAIRLTARDRFVGFEQVQRLLESATLGERFRAIDLAGCRAELAGGGLILRPLAPRHGSAVNSFQYVLSIPGEVLVREASCTISAEVAPPDAAPASWAGMPGGVAVVDAAGLDGGARIRNRRPGDRFQPLGLGGHEKLQDFFVDRKVPRSERDRVPLVVNNCDRIVWVAGHRIDEAFRVTASTKAVVILRLKDWRHEG